MIASVGLSVGGALIGAGGRGLVGVFGRKSRRLGGRGLGFLQHYIFTLKCVKSRGNGRGLGVMAL